jgi:hypothetical protein
VQIEHGQIVRGQGGVRHLELQVCGGSFNKREHTISNKLTVTHTVCLLQDPLAVHVEWLSGGWVALYGPRVIVQQQTTVPVQTVQKGLEGVRLALNTSKL